MWRLVINPDSTFRVEVDKAIELEGRLDDETLFSPPLNPPKQIDDPTDKKPKDWVDEKTVRSHAAMLLRILLKVFPA